MNLVALSTSRTILTQGSRDWNRMVLYAKHVEALHVVVLTRRQQHTQSEVIHEGALHIYPTHSQNAFMMLIDAFRISVSILKNINGKVTISAQDPLELGLLSRILAHLFQVPYTIQVHGDYYSAFWPEKSLIRRIRRSAIQFSIKSAAKVRVVSDRVARSLILRGVPREQIIVLPIRPDLEAFLDLPIRTKQHSPFTILTISRLAPEKNIPLLIRAFKKFNARHANTRLRIVGEGTELANIMQLIATNGMGAIVLCEGWTNDVSPLMAEADVFALASLHESYGLVLIEALASGVPVVTTDVGCVGELVQNGVHGIVVPVNDENAMVEAFTKLYENSVLHEEMSKKGRVLGTLVARMSEEAYAQQWVATHSA